MTLAGGGISAISQYANGLSSANAYETATNQVEYQRDKSISALKGQTESTVSSQHAAEAANGMDINSVTSTNLEVGSRTSANLDEAAIRYNANIQALQLKSQAKQAKTAGTISTLTSLIGTAGQTANDYSKWSKTDPTTRGSFLWG